MKYLKSFSASLFALFAIIAIASCSDNNDEPGITSTASAKSVEGVYIGDLDCSVMGSTDTFADLSFSIVATSDDTVTITLPAFGETPMELPSITVPDIKVTETDRGTALTTTEVSGTTDTGRNYTCTLSGEFSDDIFNVKFNLQYGAMPMPLICTAKASKI